VTTPPIPSRDGQPRRGVRRPARRAARRTAPPGAGATDLLSAWRRRLLGVLMSSHHPGRERSPAHQDRPRRRPRAAAGLPDEAAACASSARCGRLAWLTGFYERRWRASRGGGPARGIRARTTPNRSPRRGRPRPLRHRQRVRAPGYHLAPVPAPTSCAGWLLAPRRRRRGTRTPGRRRRSARPPRPARAARLPGGPGARQLRPAARRPLGRGTRRAAHSRRRLVALGDADASA